MVRHRDGASGWSDRLVNAMRVFNGDYDTEKLAEISRFGGSEIYARLIATKCRGATSPAPRHLPQRRQALGAEADARPDAARRHRRATSRKLVQVEIGTMPRAAASRPTPTQIKDRVADADGRGQARRASRRPAWRPRRRSRSSTTSSSRAASTRRSATAWSTSRCSRSSASRGRWSGSSRRSPGSTARPQVSRQAEDVLEPRQSRSTSGGPPASPTSRTPPSSSAPGSPAPTSTS